MNDAIRYARVFGLAGLLFAAMIVGMRGAIGWTLSANRDAGIADDGHLRLSIEQRQAAENDKQPYHGRQFEAQYEKL